MSVALNNTLSGPPTTAQIGASAGVVASSQSGAGAAGGTSSAASSSSAAPRIAHGDSLAGLSASVAAMSMNPAGSSTSGSGSGRRDMTASAAANPAAAAAARPNGSNPAADDGKAPSSAAKDKDDAITRQMNILSLSSGQAKRPQTVSQVSAAPSQQSASGSNASTSQSSSSSSGMHGSTTNTPHNSVIQPTSSIASSSAKKKEKQSISYAAERVIGNGSFGVVYQATVIETGETVAIKKVLQDRRFKNRELQIMGMLDHPDVVALKHCFYSKGEKPDDVFLNLVMEYIPETIHRTLRNHTKAKKLVPIMYTKVYMYQVSRALAYIHSCGICHRDIKPQNLLLNTKTHDVKLCDFGSAKILIRGEPNVAYICSRYYRAPELVFEATEYTCAIDIWSLGCVMAELLLGKPLFPGDSGVDQLIEIIKILGTPAKEQIQAMNPNHQSFKFPQIKPHPWAKVFRNKAPPDAIDLVSKFLYYEPHLRLDPFEALAHPFFDELREPNARLPNGKPLPNLFNWTESEFKRMEVVGLTKKLCPPHLIKQIREKFKTVAIPTQTPVNPYASPYPHIIAQMAAQQQQAALQAQMAAQSGGAAAGPAVGAAAAVPMNLPYGAAAAAPNAAPPSFPAGAPTNANNKSSA